MGLSFRSVEIAYKVFNEIKNTVLPDLDIPSWPEDMQEWDKDKRANPRLNRVYGFDKKSDDGWESIAFFVKEPSDELKAKFNDLESKIHNSSMAHPYSRNTDIWIFGWF